MKNTVQYEKNGPEYFVPHHVSIVMDGNGRWAQQRLMKRIMGHRAGVKAVRRAIDFCLDHHIAVLSLFALSVENFLFRPEAEVKFLISLFSDMISSNLAELNSNGVCIRVIGDISVLGATVQEQIQCAQTLTKNNTKLILVIALHYSGRWDIFQAAQKFAQHTLDIKINPSTQTEKDFSQFLCLSDLPEPDLMIRTSGEQRISNFLLWQLAYTELFFSDVFWPDFNDTIFHQAIAVFQKRQRRFGKTGEQIAL
ncbi:MAG: di-trans,poly-cis-decaprenylcistransferase [Gammaproteobacteria bacterium RIFCSPHIGHO2_12_FULL_38_11]|nr:MAG: di-trans,poly-cis-decaprenylcistransferase [Gammaproteobacteria bacterium RIFCSPHIGHO2_12_FULL_38_11]